MNGSPRRAPSSWAWPRSAPPTLALAPSPDRDSAVESFTVTTTAMAGTTLVAALLAHLATRRHPGPQTVQPDVDIEIMEEDRYTGPPDTENR